MCNCSECVDGHWLITPSGTENSAPSAPQQALSCPNPKSTGGRQQHMLDWHQKGNSEKKFFLQVRSFKQGNRHMFHQLSASCDNACWAILCAKHKDSCDSSPHVAWRCCSPSMCHVRKRNKKHSEILTKDLFSFSQESGKKQHPSWESRQHSLQIRQGSAEFRAPDK